jgi:hypothetical protein
MEIDSFRVEQTDVDDVEERHDLPVEPWNAGVGYGKVVVSDGQTTSP